MLLLLYLRIEYQFKYIYYMILYYILSILKYILYIFRRLSLAFIVQYNNIYFILNGSMRKNIQYANYSRLIIVVIKICDKYNYFILYYIICGKILPTIE